MPEPTDGYVALAVNDGANEGDPLAIGRYQGTAAALSDGELIPATLVDAPWMTTFVPHGGAVPCVLESELGTTKIEGETFLGVIHRHIPDFPPLHQGGVKYTWDGEDTYGMIERSYPSDEMSW